MGLPQARWNEESWIWKELILTFDVVEDLLDSVGLVRSGRQLGRDFQHVIRTICCEKL